ncbi:MAG TPA: hypothetical protein VG896_02400 [Candidatus Nitrosotalea sp.]|nr:hypothetical protein [Candidatus Nitrosotalea sp.]
MTELLPYDCPRGIPFCCAKACGATVAIATKVRTPSITLVCFDLIVVMDY